MSSFIITAQVSLKYWEEQLKLAACLFCDDHINHSVVYINSSRLHLIIQHYFWYLTIDEAAEQILKWPQTYRFQQYFIPK